MDEKVGLFISVKKSKGLLLSLIGVLTSLLLLTQPSTAPAADDVIEWTRQFGTTLHDWAWGSATTPAGNVYVTGQTQGVLPGGGGSLGDGAYVRKYDSSGNILWTSQFDESAARAAATDKLGQVYVAGQRGTLRKYRSGGGLLWVRDIDVGTYSDSAFGVATSSTSSDTMVYVVGESRDIGPPLELPDAFIAKYNGKGNVLWTRKFGGGPWDSATSVATDLSGNVYVAGWTDGGLDGGGTAGGRDAFVRKYDSSGNVLWTHQFGTASDDEALTAATDSAGNAFVAGDTKGALPGGGPFLGGWDAYVRKYSPSGNVLWTQQFGTYNSDGVFGATTDGTGNVYVTGETYQALPGGGGYQGGWDAYVRKYDPDGKVLWTEQFGVSTANSEGGRTATADSAGNVYVAGETTGALPGGGGSQGGGDAFLMKFGYSPDLIVQDISTNPVNPAAGQSTQVTVTVKNQSTADVTGSFWIDFYKSRATPPVLYDVGDFDCRPTGLAAGATYDCTATTSYAAAGTYQMWAQVDTGAEVGETNESNNIFGPQAIVVGPSAQPDLIVQSIATNPVSPAPGEATDVTVTVKNQGGGNAVNAFNVDFYKDKEPTGSAGDFDCKMQGLHAGVTALCKGSVSYASAGNYKMYAVADTFKHVAESNETNNVLGPQTIVVAAAAQPDLIVQSIATNPVSPAPGEATDVTVTVKNQGGGNAVNAFNVDFYKDKEPTGSAGDFDCKMQGLPAGVTALCKGSVSYASAGNYKMYAVADTFKHVAESNETNNVLGPQTIVVAATSPDVSVSLVPDSTTAPRGGTVGYQVAVTNNTAVSQTFQYWTNVRLPSGVIYPPSGALFGPFTVTLGPSQTRSAHLTQGIPAFAPLGIYTYYGAIGSYPDEWDVDSFAFEVTP